MDYDFLLTPDEKPKTFNDVPDTPRLSLKSLTPKAFVADIGKAYTQLGGLTWLVTQATAAPAEFMKLLQKLIPKTVDIDLMAGTTVKLIDQYGQSIEVSKNNPNLIAAGEAPCASSSPARPGQPSRQLESPLVGSQSNDGKQIATGGSQVTIKETYDV